jgi:hypothetical protein
MHEEFLGILSKILKHVGGANSEKSPRTYKGWGCT